MTALRLDHPQRSAAWLEARRQFVTASDVPVLLGLSPYKSEATLAAEKLTGEQQAESIPMRLGTVLEPLIAELFAEQTGRQLRRYEGMVVHESGLLAASPDWEDDLGLVETKWTTSHSRFADGLPQDVEAQVQVQMGCTGIHRADVAVLAGNELLPPFPVVFDPELFAHLLTVAADFRRRLADGGPFAHDAASLKAAYPADNGVEMVADEYLDAVVRQLVELRTTRKAMEERETALENAIKERMAEFAALRGDGWRVTWKKTKDREETDWKLVAQGLLRTLPETERDVLVGLHSTVRTGFRPFRVTVDKED